MNIPVSASLNPKVSSAKFRVLGALVAGASLEFYDFFVYGTATSLVFPKLFFPSEGDVNE